MSQTAGQDLKSAIKIVLVGGSGRMGRHIAAVIEDTAGLTLVHRIAAGDDWAQITDSPDVVIDFSQPAGLRDALAWCVRRRTPLVSGTTGLNEADHRALREASLVIPILYSANMSPGIAVLSAMLEHFANLPDWDFHVDEIHHNQKKDAPSGTALLLDTQLSAAVGRPLPRPNSIRGGTVPGLHQVWAMGPDEVLLLQHTALDRRVFARGAVRAAGWLFDKAQPGFYELKDLYKK